MRARARYLEWANSFDPEWFRAFWWAPPRIASAVVGVGLLVAAGTLPSASEFFALRLGPALGLLALALSALLTAGWLEARGTFSATGRATTTLCVTFVVQIFASGLVVLASAPGTFAMAIYPIVVAWFHLGAMRSGPRHPFATAVHGAAIAVCAGTAPDTLHVGLLAMVALLGLGGGTLLGMLTTRAAIGDARLEAQRAALAAQGLAAVAMEIEDVEATLGLAASRGREAQTMLERAQSALVGLPGASPAGNEGVARAGAALERLARLLAAPAARTPGGRGAGAAGPVALAPPVADLDPSLLDPRVWVPIRLGTGASLVGIAWAVTSLPGLSPFFELRPTVPLALVSAAVALVFALGAWRQWRGDDPTILAVGVLGSAFVEEMACASFAVFSELPGAFVLVALPVLRAALNGLALGAAVGLAAATAAHGLGVLAATALRPEAPHVWLLLATAFVSMVLFAHLAGMSRRIARSRALVATQGAALQAELVAEQSSNLQGSRTALDELHGRLHQARSALSTARLATDRLAGVLRGDEDRSRDLGELISALDGLQRLISKDPTRDDRSPATPGLGFERVEVEPVVRAVLEAVRKRAPGLRASCDVAPPRVAARMRGGAIALQQLLGQLATNAAEGDGTRRAQHVDVSVLGNERMGSLAIRIADDGPGFPPRFLEQPPVPFLTTKSRPLGLGLYTSSCLARASGGSLRLEHRPGGGAIVTVYLELARDPATLGSVGAEPPCTRPGALAGIGARTAEEPAPSDPSRGGRPEAR